MFRIPFGWWHAIVLLLILVPPKLSKALMSVSDLSLWDLALVHLPDLFFVLVIEALLLGGADLLPRAGRKLVRSLWGLALMPMAAYAVTEHRFFLSSGSMLDWNLFTHALLRVREISGVLGAEIDPMWWVLLIIPIPLGLISTVMGWKSAAQGPPAASRSLVSVAIGLAGLLGLTSWCVQAMKDPRLASLKGSTFMTLGIGALDAFSDEGRPVSLATVDARLPDPISLHMPQNVEPQNVVFIILESVRASATTPYVPELDSSPFLGKLAAEGMVVERGYTILPHTTKSLIPILCGITPDIRQALSETIPGAIPVTCLATQLGELGYATAYFQPATGKFEKRKELVAAIGFEYFAARENLPRRGWESPNYLGVEDKAMIKPILRWVDKQDGPFFISLLTLITHHNYKVPTTFKKKKYPGSQRWSNYLNTVRYTDEFLQELFEGFDDRGLLDNTLFVIIGDHGEGHGEHGRKGHDALIFQEGIHVPYVLWSRKLIPKPVRIKGNRLNIDLAPTVVSLLGLEVTGGKYEGKSLLENVDDRVSFVSCWYEDRCLGRLEGAQKVIYNYDRRPLEVFNLDEDPQERRNLAAKLDPGLAERYVAEMKAWKQGKRALYARYKQLISKGYIFNVRPTPEFKLDAQIGRHLKVVGYEMGSAKPGREATLSLYFEVLKNLGWHRRFKLAVVDSDGRRWPVRFRSTLEKHPMFAWVPGQFMRVDFRFSIPRRARSGGGTIQLIQMRNKKKVSITGEDAERSKRRLVVPLYIE